MERDRAPDDLVKYEQDFLKKLKTQLKEAEDLHTNLKTQINDWDPDDPIHNDMAPSLDEE